MIPDSKTGNPSSRKSTEEGQEVLGASLWSFVPRLARTALQCVVAIVCLVCFAGWLAPFETLFELALHFRLHLLVVSMLLLAVVWFAGQRWLWLPLLICVATCLLSIEPWSVWGPAPTAREDLTSDFTVLSWNVLASNRHRKDAAAFLKGVDADVLILVEPQPDFTEGMDFLAERYPYSFALSGWGGGGLSVYSKLSGTVFRKEEFGYKYQPAVVATIPNAQGKKLELVAVHALSPLPRYRAKLRDEQLSQLELWSGKGEVPVVACGDMNITPWAPAFQRLLRSGFRDSRVGAGNCSSWPSSYGALGIPIDHALSKGDCQILERKVLAEAPGSDHRPISFRIRF